MYVAFSSAYRQYYSATKFFFNILWIFRQVWFRRMQFWAERKKQYESNVQKVRNQLDIILILSFDPIQRMWYFKNDFYNPFFNNFVW